LKGNFADVGRDNQMQKNRIKTMGGKSVLEKMNFDQYQKLKASSNRMFFFEKVHMDEQGKRITDHEVYKEIMTFFKLLEKDMFGGRVMVTRNHQHYQDDTDTSRH
jgi:hypothetical protein